MFRKRLMALTSLMHAKCCETLRDGYESPSLGDFWLDDSAVKFINGRGIAQELIAAGTPSEPLRDRSAQAYTWLIMLVSGRFYKIPSPHLQMMLLNLNSGTSSTSTDDAVVNYLPFDPEEHFYLNSGKNLK